RESIKARRLVIEDIALAHNIILIYYSICISILCKKLLIFTVYIKGKDMLAKTRKKTFFLSNFIHIYTIIKKKLFLVCFVIVFLSIVFIQIEICCPNLLYNLLAFSCFFFYLYLLLLSCIIIALHLRFYTTTKKIVFVDSS
ncbi:hypothetical protein ACJX0J_022790, partial [Zea mays]